MKEIIPKNRRKECNICGIVYDAGVSKGTKTYESRKICSSFACRKAILRQTRRASGMGGIAALSKEIKAGIAREVKKVKKKVASDNGVPVSRVPPGVGYHE